MPITLKARRELVEGLIPLNLHLAWRLLRQGHPFEEVLNARVDIYRYTSLYDGKVMPFGAPPGWRDERWEGMLTRLRRTLRRHAAASESLGFEREGYELLRPLLETALARGVAQWPRIEDRPYGFFTYDLTELAQPPACAIGLHLANPFAPLSPFVDPQERLRELQRLLADVSRAHPEVTHVSTGTWLNSFEPFLALFPPEWAASAAEVTVLFKGAGLWGQFYDRRGGFHRKNAEYLRRTGDFPYPPMKCQCRIDTLKAWLSECRESRARQPGTRYRP